MKVKYKINDVVLYIGNKYGIPGKEKQIIMGTISSYEIDKKFKENWYFVKCSITENENNYDENSICLAPVVLQILLENSHGK